MKKFLTAAAALTGATAMLASTATAAPPAPAPTIVDVAVSVSGAPGVFDDDGGDFDILVAAVIALDLDEALAERGQRTVFAPTDAAFVDLAELLTDSSDLTEEEAFAIVAGVDGVASIVAHHVAPGARLAEDVVPADRIRTIAKDFILKDADTATLDAGLGRTATIVAADIPASNGVIHAIDAVLLP